MAALAGTPLTEHPRVCWLFLLLDSICLPSSLSSLSVVLFFSHLCVVSFSLSFSLYPSLLYCSLILILFLLYFSTLAPGADALCHRRLTRRRDGVHGVCRPVRRCAGGVASTLLPPAETAVPCLTLSASLAFPVTRKELGRRGRAALRGARAHVHCRTPGDWGKSWGQKRIKDDPSMANQKSGAQLEAFSAWLILFATAVPSRMSQMSLEAVLAVSADEQLSLAWCDNAGRKRRREFAERKESSHWNSRHHGL